ncbi:MAG: glutamate--tRNA ligase [Clostridia bacterium]|nr:glutamate--tRNA ligase [Clostridia bacterium]
MIRTRFAPSPTGYMHLGNLRTALYAYLFAKKKGGSFILRIEDTDQEREVEGAVELIYKSLRQAGLTYDEGPDVGGDFGPYIQSQRKEIYLPLAMSLVEKGAAYPCFCTKEALAERRETAEAKSPGQWKYDKYCLGLPRQDAARRMESGEPFVIRQNIPTTGAAGFEDALYGHVEAPCDTLDDAVLIKADGLPTYNFANVVDDHLMGITHVMRGTEYLSSTPKYNLLYEAFGWKPPLYVHMPPVMKDAARKLSKRHGDPSFEDLLAQGYVKDAILNFIALLGWSPGDEREFFTLAELVETFDLKGLSKAPAIFNTEKLLWFNHAYISRMPIQEYTKTATPWFDMSLAGRGIDYAFLATLMHSRTQVFGQVPDMVRFLADFPDYDIALYTRQKMKTDPETALFVLNLARPALTGLPEFSEAAVKEALMALATRHGLKTGQIMWPVRIAVSGQESTPGGATEIACLLGKDETLRRIDRGIALLERGTHPLERIRPH